MAGLKIGVYKSLKEISKQWSLDKKFSPKVNKNTVTKDKRLSGKYLVNSITHILNRDKLTTRITLTRDSFGGKNISDKPPKGNQNQVSIGK